jgi:hypothetical protein
MKKYIIKQDLLTKVKAFLKVSQEQNVSIQYNSAKGLINELEKLLEYKNTKKKKTFFFDVYFNGVHPVTDILHEKSILIKSKEFLSSDDIEAIIWKHFKFVHVSVQYREIFSEEFEILGEEFPIIKA